ncbi:hypothetical protein BC937DRAFT_90772 [Endogone sp. FLAS-F59071]|nr:hypothetical protein BC937DRAFT_90772 [Endogone sp. FLAS-F59071]|eukprot:RUS16806.1 hypothetical protein BC937DRAFT_90772 [Endogone sp. FLAS-F59071]
MAHRNLTANSTLTANSLSDTDIELGPRTPVNEWIIDDHITQSPINIDPVVYPTGPVDTLRTTTPHANTIHTTVCSPDGAFLATLSGEGVVALWPFAKSSQLLKPHFAFKTPFNLEHSERLNRRIIVTVSNGGRYIALTSCERVKEYKELKRPNNFLLIDTEAQQAIQPLPLRHACGIVSFFKDDVLATCDGSYIRIHSVHLGWIMIRKLNMSVLFEHPLMKYPQPLQQLVDMFGYNRIFWFENDNMISMWEISSGALQARFTLPQDYDETSFAVSPNGHLFATCTTPKPASGEFSFLTVYFVESGLALQQIALQDEVYDIFFMEECEHILSYGPNADKTGYITRVYDSYSLRVLKVYEGKLPADRLFLFAENPNLLVLRNIDNTLETYSSVIEEVSDNPVEVMKYPDGQLVSKDQSMHIRTVIEEGKYSVEFVDGTLGSLVNICFWGKEVQQDLTAEFLDDQGNRVLIVSRYLILVFFTKKQKPELQYLWSIPKHINKDNDTIQTVYLDFKDSETIVAYVHLSGPDDVIMTVNLPAPQDRHTNAITQDLCESLALIRANMDREEFQKDDLVKHCKEVIKMSIPKNPTLFSRASSTVFPMREFIYANWDDIVVDILAKNQYVPCFYGETKESALTLAVRLRKGPIVKQLIEYYSKKAKDDPNYMILVCPALSFLRRYPDYVALMMKDISYNFTPPSSLIRQLPTDIRPNVFERSSKSEMETYCLMAQQLTTREKSFIHYPFDMSYQFGVLIGDAIQKIVDYFNEPEEDKDEYRNDTALLNTLKTHPVKLCNGR